jgi:hypothetical protein
MSLFRKVVNDVCTGIDGVSVDPARLIGYGFVLVAANVWLGATVYEIWKTGHFDGTNFAISLAGVATALMAAAGGVAFKSSTEPTAVSTPSVTPPTTAATTPAKPDADSDDNVAAGIPAPSPAATTTPSGVQTGILSNPSGIDNTLISSPTATSLTAQTVDTSLTLQNSDGQQKAVLIPQFSFAKDTNKSAIINPYPQDLREGIRDTSESSDSERLIYANQVPLFSIVWTTAGKLITAEDVVETSTPVPLPVIGVIGLVDDSVASVITSTSYPKPRPVFPQSRLVTDNNEVTEKPRKRPVIKGGTIIPDKVLKK